MTSILARIMPNVYPSTDIWTTDQIFELTRPYRSVERVLRPSVKVAIESLSKNGFVRSSTLDRIQIAGALQLCKVIIDHHDLTTANILSAPAAIAEQAREQDNIRQALRAAAQNELEDKEDEIMPDYRPDFYQPANAIGYTGYLMDYPTIYFRTNTEFGRITQKHVNKLNVGRTPVQKASKMEYLMEIGHKGQLVEFAFKLGNPGGIYHASRYPFVPIAGSELAQETIDLQAIQWALARYPFQKGTPRAKYFLKQAEDGEWCDL